MEESYDLFDYHPTWFESGVKTVVLQITKLPEDGDLAEKIKQATGCESVKTENFQNLKLTFNSQEEFEVYIRSLPINAGKPNSEINIPDLVMTSIVSNNVNSQIQNLCRIVNDIFTANKAELNTILRESLLVVDDRISVDYLIAEDCIDGPFRSVEKINLPSNNRDGAKIITILDQFPAVKYLNLSKSCSSEESIKKLNDKLRDCPNIIYLDLSSNNLGAKGASMLSNISTLEYLYALVLTENSIGDEGMKSIKEYIFKGKVRISQLDINKNGLTIEGFKQYKEVLKYNLVRSLDLSNTSLSSEILEIIMAPESLHHYE